MTTLKYDMKILDEHAMVDIAMLRQFLGVSDSTVRRKIRKGLLPKPFKWGDSSYYKLMWRTVALKKFFSNLEREQAKAQMF